MNYPPSETYTYGPDNELILFESFDSLSEITIPVGWPLHYLNPTPTPTVPVIVGTPKLLPGTGAAVISWEAAGLNALAIGYAIFCLIYCSQRLMPRFTIRSVLMLTLLLVAYLKISPLIAEYGGYIVALWLFHAIYFGPIVLAATIAVLRRVDWGQKRDEVLYRFLSPRQIDESGDEHLAAAAKLEQSGEWDQAIHVYRIAAEKWPQHRSFANNCIASIKEKQST